MSESFATTLEWRGSHEIAQRLAGLIPNGISSELIQEGINDSESVVMLVVKVESDSLENLRKVVDDLLALFSDHDQ